MKRCLVIIGICFFAAICFGQAQSTYHNPAWHFSFLLPEGWEQIPVDELSSSQQQMLKRDFRSKTVAVCQKIGAEYFTTPYILVQVKSSEEVPEAVIEKLVIEERDKTLKVLEMNIDRLQKGKHFSMLKSWKGAERIGAKVDYDRDKHISFEMAMLHHESLGDIVAVTVKLLGSHRMVSLQCFADGEDVENFLDLVNRVVDSFTYDKGYGFGEGKGVAPALTKKLLGGGIWSWVLWGVGILIVSWLIRRWVSG